MRDLQPKPLVWTLPLAVGVCKIVEDVVSKFGAHVALTGAVLYKDGPRKDLDLVLYSISGTEVDIVGITAALGDVGFTFLKDYGFVLKAEFEGLPLDILLPERDTSPKQCLVEDDEIPAYAAIEQMYDYYVPW